MVRWRGVERRGLVWRGRGPGLRVRGACEPEGNNLIASWYLNVGLMTRKVATMLFIHTYIHPW